MKHIRSFVIISLTILGALAIASCEKEQKLVQPDALFRPIVSNPEFGGDWIEVKWDKYLGADYFELKIVGKDGLNETVQTDTTFYRFEGLNYDTSYDIMIRSISRSSGLTSRFFNVPTVTTNDFPTKLKAVESIDTKAIVSWENEALTTLKFFTYVLDENNERVETAYCDVKVPEGASSLLVGDLAADSNYAVYAYNGDSYKGKKLFKTKPSAVYDGYVVDLRSLSEEAAYGAFTQAFVNEQIESHPGENITFVLNGGTRYELGTVNVNNCDQTVTIVTGLSFAGKATFEVSGSIAVASGCNVNTITIKDIVFTEHPSKTKESSNYGGTYLFNFNQSNAALTTLNLQNCDIRYKRGVLRSQTTATIDNVNIDGCTFDYIGGYGITNADNAAAATRNIRVSNSTFVHCEKLFVASKPTDKDMTFECSNCTFCWCPKTNGNYVCDFNGMNVTPKFSKCIFGPAGLDDNYTTVGMRASRSATGSVDTDRCYCTSDHFWYADATGAIVAAMDLTSINADVNGTFAGAVTNYAAFEEGDFTIISQVAKDAGVGDPRWL